MNYARLTIAAVAATVVDAIYGFGVYGTALTSQFAKYPGVYRPAAEQTPYLAPLFCGVFVAMLAASYIYAKGYDGGSGLAEGMRFGIIVGLLIVGYTVIIGYATMNVGPRHSGLLAVTALVEWMIAGVVIGLVYKPLPGAMRRATGV
jgi:hypothetical protein